MKISLPAYLVALFVSFAYAVIHYYVPTLPLTQDQVQWVVVMILTAAGVDVVNAIRSANPTLLAKK